MLQIETSNGAIQVSEVKMFHAKAVARWRGLVAAAQEKLGGVQTGLGFIGSPGWVVTGALVLGALEGALSSANAKIGIKLLGEADSLLEEMHARGVFVPISAIANVDRPQPEMWRATIGTIEYMLMASDFIKFRVANGEELNVRWSAVNTTSLKG